MEAGFKKFSARRLVYKLRTFALQQLHPDWPWWPKEAVLLCSKLLKANDTVLEFGAGRSTFWLAKRCAFITSIEHHKDWYDFVNKKIETAGLGNKVKLVHAPITSGIEPDKQEYLLAVKNMPPESVDMVIIDGKFRAQAALLSLPLLKPGGTLIIDDAHRFLPERNTGAPFPVHINQDIWKLIDAQTRDWKTNWISDGVHATYFLFKPGMPL